MTADFPQKAIEPLERLSGITDEIGEAMGSLQELFSQASRALEHMVPDAAPEPAPEPAPDPETPADPAPRPPVTGGEGSDLPTLELDLPATIEAGTIKTKGQHFGHTDRGARIYVPETGGGPIPLRWAALRIAPNSTRLVGDTAHFILTGPGASFAIEEDTGGIDLNARVPQRVTFELDGVEIDGSETYSANAINVPHPCTVIIRRCRVHGARNGLALANGPTDLLVEDSEFSHSGGSGKYHNFYAGLIRRADIRNSQFHSAKAEAHAFKCYAKHLDMRGCHITHYIDPQDADAGFYGKLPPVDLGAWGDTVLYGNRLERRGDHARPDVISYRNRPYWPNVRPYDPPDWGHVDVPWQAVDNRDPANPHLFRHILAANTFVNTAGEGWAVRNNGTAPWKTAADVPEGWSPNNERAVVYLYENQWRGQPFAQTVQNVPYYQPFLLTPYRAAPATPEWALQVIDRSAEEAMA